MPAALLPFGLAGIATINPKSMSSWEVCRVRSSRYIERDGILLIRDYCEDGLQYNDVYEHIQKLNSSELLDLEMQFQGR